MYAHRLEAWPKRARKMQQQQQNRPGGSDPRSHRASRCALSSVGFPLVPLSSWACPRCAWVEGRGPLTGLEGNLVSGIRREIQDRKWGRRRGKTRVTEVRCLPSLPGPSSLPPALSSSRGKKRYIVARRSRALASASNSKRPLCLSAFCLSSRLSSRAPSPRAKSSQVAAFHLRVLRAMMLPENGPLSDFNRS